MIFSKLPLIDLLVRQTKERTGLKMSLNFKLLLILLSVLLVGALTSSFLVLNLQRQQLIESSEVASTRASSAIAASLEHAMMISDLAMGNGIAGSAVSQDGIERIHVMNPQGVVRVSSDPLEIGKQYDRNQAMCQGCHLDGDVLTATHVRYNASTGHEVLLTVKPIRNQVQCTQCHDSQTKVLGLLMMERSLADLNNVLTAREGRIILSAVVTFVLMAGLILFARRRFVIRPVSDLAKGMAQVGSGNLDYRVLVLGNDQLADLAMAFDTMRQHLKESQIEIFRGNQGLTVLYQVALATAHLVELEQILRIVLEIVVDNCECRQLSFIYGMGIDSALRELPVVNLVAFCRSRGESSARFLSIQSGML